MKPTLTPEQSAALSEALKRQEKSTVLRWHAKNPNGWLEYTPMFPLNGLDLMTLSAALVNGWDVEKLPIDLLRDEYLRVIDLRDIGSNVDYWCRGVREALCATGQVIEGINA